jgi:uncharacterized protein YxeA
MKKIFMLIALLITILSSILTIANATTEEWLIYSVNDEECINFDYDCLPN